MTPISGQQKMTLYGTSACHLCELAEEILVGLVAAGAAPDFEKVDIADDDALFERYGERIPVLRDTSVATEGVAGTIADSSAICGFLERKFPDNPVYPADPHCYGRALWIEEYADSHLAATGGLGIFRAVFFNMMQGKDPDVETARETWAEKMPPILTYLDSALGDSEFYAGDAFSIADITVTTCLMQIALVAEMPLDAYPALAAHQERMRARASIAGPFSQADGFIGKSLPEKISLT